MVKPQYYELLMPRDTLDAARCAIKVLQDLCAGDFRPLGKLRTRKVSGKPLDRDMIKRVLHDLPLACFGESGKPELGRVAQRRNDGRILMGKLNEACATSTDGVSMYRTVVSADTAWMLMGYMESYARLLSGQLDILASGELNVYPWDVGHTRNSEIRSMLVQLKEALFGLDPNASLGVMHEGAHRYMDICWDFYQVIRYRLSWDRNPSGGIQVCFDKPMHCASGVPLPVVNRLVQT
jgi:hypothetical protein